MTLQDDVSNELAILFREENKMTLIMSKFESSVGLFLSNSIWEINILNTNV